MTNYTTDRENLSIVSVLTIILAMTIPMLGGVILSGALLTYTPLSRLTGWAYLFLFVGIISLHSACTLSLWRFLING